MSWLLDRFLSVEDEDLVSPHRFEDNTLHVLFFFMLSSICLSFVWA